MNHLAAEYLILFNGTTDAIKQMENMVEQMKLLQIQAEEAYLSASPIEDFISIAN